MAKRSKAGHAPVDISAKVSAAARSYPTRSAAAHAAQREGFTGFRCEFDLSKQRWFFRVMTVVHADTVEFAKGLDWVHHIEHNYRDIDGMPVVQGVVVVTITREELDEELAGLTVPEGTTFAPLTRDLWDGEVVDGKRTKITKTGPRAVSGVEKPVEVVWRIAAEMKGKDRKEVIEACVAAGVNKSTASTQFYKWSKANNG